MMKPLHIITKRTTVNQLMNDSLCGKFRSVYDENGIIIGTIKFVPSSAEWIEEQKQMKDKQ